jgi:hypothetical protein
MAKSRLFFPQQTLDAWLEQERVMLVDDEMTLRPDGPRYKLSAALRMLAEVAEGTDPHELVGKVKAVDQLKALGGEHCADSLVLGDNAYSVVEGFLGEPLDGAPVSRGAAHEAAGAGGPSQGELDPVLRLLLERP